MRVAVFGGSFHPPHVGHALVAAWLRWTDRADEVWLVPVGQHAFGKSLAPFSLRVAWCEALAGAVGPGVRVCDIEGQLPAPSYTVATLDALSAAWPGHRFRLVVGVDVLSETAKWRSWDRIATVYPPIVVGRAGHGDVPDAPTFPAISSTDVRRRLVAGGPVDAWVPAAVCHALEASGWGPGAAGWSGGPAT